MTPEIKISLVEAGMNYDSALERFMNNEAMLEKFLVKFLTDPSYQALKDAVENRDLKKAFEASHTLKGVAANFSFDKLCEVSSKQCEEFRAERFEEGALMMDVVSEEYERIASAIRINLGE